MLLVARKSRRRVDAKTFSSLIFDLSRVINLDSVAVSEIRDISCRVMAF